MSLLIYLRAYQESKFIWLWCWSWESSAFPSSSCKLHVWIWRIGLENHNKQLKNLRERKPRDPDSMASLLLDGHQGPSGWCANHYHFSADNHVHHLLLQLNSAQCLQFSLWESLFGVIWGW
ncbi:unnamed protein product [Cuscuta campestris]|uniref:Uncharacterized protein n=1 Tax=Cuscuta campestris TaxID=132261 RepID=A0A484M3W9_9ASTE|nr:unnamed protein product [Cuscuta campestris]